MCTHTIEEEEEILTSPRGRSILVIIVCVCRPGFTSVDGAFACVAYENRYKYIKLMEKYR
jgi:hypothetical protein